MLLQQRINSKMILCLWVIVIFPSCKKLVEIPQPVSTVTADKIFSTDANATSAISAIYSDMTSTGGNVIYANGASTVFTGLCSDELISTSNYSEDVPFQTNTLLRDNRITYNGFWIPAYKEIYMANAAIEGLQNSTTVSAAVARQLTGEAKFLRAFCHFYLVNLFGDVPLITQTSWEKINTLPRSSVEQVYQQIVADLKDAQNLLVPDYSLFNGERIRATKWAATSLLARVYLYRGDWANAEAQATLVINNSSLYSLPADLNDVFLKNSPEAIWQLQTIDNSPWTTQEGNLLVPPDAYTLPNYSLSDSMLGAFDPNDQRRFNWIDSSDYSGTLYYYPYKYKEYQGSPGSLTEYYMLLRLGEQYLIRAEARAHLNTNLLGAINDINATRTRAGLPGFSPTLTQTQVFSAVIQERRIELFAECGHRWFDLKRTGQANAILSISKPSWQSYAQLWPIPAAELAVDPNLTQNPGY
jgi:hypothetical protein